LSQAAKTRRKNRAEEAKFSTEMIRGAHAKGFAFAPIPDSVGRHQRKKVYDLILLRDGLYHGIELKQTGIQSLKASKFKAHQLPMLRRVAECGGMSWVGCVFHDTPTRFREVWFCWSEHARRFLTESGETTLTLDWFRKWGIQLPKFQAPVLDPDTFDTKIDDHGNPTGSGRAWDFTPAHEKALEFLRRQS
jgi:Holliday junction resolvase